MHPSRSPQLARSALCVAAVVALLACSSQPLPLSVQAGASFALAVSGESGAALGYGGAWLAAAGRYDDQRGELAFVLVAPNGAEHALATKLVTRLWPDPASDGGIANDVGGALFPGVGLAEAIAVVDVPAATPPGAYRLEIRRKRRLSATQWETLPGVDYAQSLSVLPATLGGATGAPTPPSGYAGPLGSDMTARLAALHPHPKLVLRLPDPVRPAAAHLVLAYPPTKVRVRSVFEEQHLGRGSVVAWSDDAAAGRLTIEFADPAASVSALAVAFELRDPFGAGRAAEVDFSVVASALYDGRGVARPGVVGVGPIR